MTTDYDKRLAELSVTGATARKIAEILKAEGHKTSRSKVGRELVPLRGTQRVGRRPASGSLSQAAAAGPLPTQAEIDSADLSTREEWLELAARSARAAEARGDMAAVARFGALGASLFESIRKAAPKEVPPEGTFVTRDDMKALADKGERMLDQLVNGLFEETATWPKCPTCGHALEPTK